MFNFVKRASGAESSCAVTVQHTRSLGALPQISLALRCGDWWRADLGEGRLRLLQCDDHLARDRGLHAIGQGFIDLIQRKGSIDEGLEPSGINEAGNVL